MELKKRLYELRNEKGYSVAILSKKSGVAASHIQRIENGAFNIILGVLDK